VSHKQLALELNRIKALMNEMTERIKEESMNSSEPTGEVAAISESSPQLSHTKADLDSLKKLYKTNYASLQLCKENISVLEIDKKSSLSNLMTAFQSLSTSSTV